MNDQIKKIIYMVYIKVCIYIYRERDDIYNNYGQVKLKEMIISYKIVNGKPEWKIPSCDM
jgi:hypothetical protein